MRRTGGFRSKADFETFGRTLEEQGFNVNVKPLGVLICMNVQADKVRVELQMREAQVPENQSELTPADEKLLEIVNAKYPYEGKPRMQFSC